jgi:hypothetical protein
MRASFSHQRQEQVFEPSEVVAFDLGIKTLAVGTNEHSRVYHQESFREAPAFMHGEVRKASADAKIFQYSITFIFLTLR